MQGSGTAKLTSPGAALRIPGSTPHKLNARYEPVMYLPRQYGEVCRLPTPVLQKHVPDRQVLLVFAVTEAVHSALSVQDCWGLWCFQA